MFYHINYVKDLFPRVGHFWPKGYNLNTLGKGTLGEARY